jgi:hypothetical protein
MANGCPPILEIMDRGQSNLLIILVGRAGIEPATNGLKVSSRTPRASRFHSAGAAGDKGKSGPDGRKVHTLGTGWRRAAAIAMLALAGCATDGTHVIVQWSSPEWIHAQCGPTANACQSGKVIFARRPENFDDNLAFCYLGHELFHRLGGTHEGRGASCKNGWIAPGKQPQDRAAE